MHLRKISLLSQNYPTNEHYPFNLRILRETSAIELTTPITFFVGENGTGKSTLLEAVSLRSGIHIWKGLERTRCTSNPYECALYRFIDCDWTDGSVPGSFFGSSTFRNFATLLDELASMDPGLLDYFGGKSLLTQSHGQSLMSFFRSRYTIKGLYLLDEPETALSPKTQLLFLDLLTNMSLAGHAQFIIATHSPILLACPGSVIYSFDHVPARRLNYDETDHFRIYKEFMANPGRVVENAKVRGN
jgi:predicted ATPase